MTIVDITVYGRPATEVLAWSRSVVDPAMRTAVAGLPASMRRIAEYHLGWRDENDRPVDAGAGKALRPALVLLSAEAVGGDPAGAVPAAVAVELAHNSSLVHDDVLDGDTTRRHRPTVWARYGSPAAILGGDALLVLAFDVLAASGHDRAAQGTRMLHAAFLDLLNGQDADLAFERRADVDLPECLDMARAKTGALLACSCALGALVGGGTPAQVERLGAFGARLGLAFQLVDDLLGIWGDTALTGKPLHSDLASRKKTLPVVAALSSGTEAGRDLAALYARDEPLAGPDLERAAELVDLAGGRAWSRTRADQLMARALDDLRSAEPRARARAELTALANLVVDRDQ
jgi:geranylgeranyl diphosphate synthase, type I